MQCVRLFLIHQLRTVGKSKPVMSTLRPVMRRRIQIRDIIEGARLDEDQPLLACSFRVRHNRRTAIRTEVAENGLARGSAILENGEISLDLQLRARKDRHHGERASGLLLAISAVADHGRNRIGGNAISNLAAKASAGSCLGTGHAETYYTSCHIGATYAAPGFGPHLRRCIS